MSPRKTASQKPERCGKTAMAKAVARAAIPIQVRQGDVMLDPVEELPQEAKRASDCVLVRGVATGHSHRFERGATQWIAPDNRRYVVVDAKTASLLHDEHATIKVPRGVYLVQRQREYAPEANRPVAD